MRGALLALTETARAFTALMVAVAVVLGVLLGSVQPSPPGAALVVVIALGLLGAALGRHWRAVWLPALCLAALALGVWRYDSVRPPGGAAGLSFYIGRDVTIVGTVSAEPEPLDHGENVRVDAETITVGGATRRVSGTMLVHLSVFSALAYGDRVSLAGRLAAPPVLPGPGNYPAYLAAQGIYSVMDYPRLSHLGTGAGNPLLALAIALRQFLEGGIRHALPDPQAALLFGILLGTRTRALGALTNPFIVTGMIHVIAISGLKVSIVAGSVAAVARRFLSARLAWLPPAAALLLYVLMTGATPAGLRSALMWGLALAALRFGRRSDAATSLALAAALLALLNPRIPWDLGFQLSLAGTAAIVLLEPGIEHRLRRLPAVMRETAAVTLAAQIGTLPLLISGFGQVSLSAPLANALLLPLLGPIMALGFVVALAGAVLPALGILLGWLLYPLLTLMIAGVQFLARLPLAALPAATWPLLPVAGYYALVGLAAWRPLRATPALHIPTGMFFGKVRPLWLLGASGALLLATLAWQAPRPVYTLSILYLRDGQGIMLTTPHGHTVLIDGGDAPSLLDAALGGRLPFWRSRLDLVTLSDTDAAHVGGLRDLTARYGIARALDPGAVYPSATYALWRAALRDAGVPEAKLRLGARYRLDRDAYLDVLLPSALNPYDAGARTALRLVLGRFSLLLLNRYALVADPSEIGADGWRRDTMLVLPSGASDPGLTAAWIRSQRPRLVVLPSSDDARDDPTADAVARRAARGMGAQVWQSSKGRSLEITTDGLRYTVRVMP